ncbi:MAG: glycosyl hydrolase family 28 protein [Verrucomicrobiota bacterium]
MKLRNYFTFRAPLLLSAAGLLSLVMATLAQPALPNINTNNIFNITNYGAVGDGVITNTTAIQAAIAAAAAATAGVGGGTVEIPGPGTYLCGPLTMQSKVNLQIDTNATLLFLPENKYPNATGSPASPITFGSLTDVEISGTGTIDGNGAGWWSADPPSRPYMIYFSKCVRVLIQSVTLQNPPMMHIVFKSGGGNITIQGININTTNPLAANTDGIDLIGTNCLVQNCTINAGDDNIAIGSSSIGSPCNNTLITNCTFGTGHGVSLGGNTQGGVSNLTVINCTFNGTDNGIRMKSDNLTTGGDGEGGVAQNLYYYNIRMTNITYAPIIIYSYYKEYGNPTTANIAPAKANSITASNITSFTPVWRNIVISNLTATAGQPGMIWARTEMPATNIILNRLNITASGSFDLYHTKQVQIIDSQFQVGNVKTFALFDAQVTFTNNFTNTFGSTNLITLDGLSTSTYGNTLALYNSQAYLSKTNIIDFAVGPLTLGDSILNINSSWTLFPNNVLNFTVDQNTNQVAVTGDLTLAGTINTSSGPGFGAGTYTLLTYTGNLSGNLPTLGSTPGGIYTYALDTSTAGQVNLIVTPPAPPAPTNFTAVGTNLLINLNWNAVSGATYNLKRGTVNNGPYPTVFSGLTATNYADAAVTNAVAYYYVVTAVSGGESTNSLQAGATPLPSSVPTNIVAQASSGQLQLSWPQDHLGWQLQIQTNDPDAGLGNNWVNVPNSTATNQYFLPINPTNGSVFLRLVYP